MKKTIYRVMPLKGELWQVRKEAEGLRGVSVVAQSRQVAEQVARHLARRQKDAEVVVEEG
jgi:hypothetical protein